MEQQQSSKKIPARGKRYSPAMKEEILQYTAAHGPSDAMRKYGCSIWTIKRWQKEVIHQATAKATQSSTPPSNFVQRPEVEGGPDYQGTHPVSPETEQAASAEASDTGALPLTCDPARAGTQANHGDSQGRSDAESENAMPKDEKHQLILNMWKQHPLLGPSQIKNQLRRQGHKMSVNTVRNVMEEHGYVTPRIKRKEHTGSYEAVRPRHLYHLDFFHLYVHKQKQVLLFIEDDFSRFIAGWTLVETEKADAVIDAFEKAVARYGKPEAVMTDRGTAFHSWSGVTRFENLLVEYGIDHLIARQPQPNGKVEALNATVQRELVRKVEFRDLTDAAQQIEKWVRYYNFERTHHALGGILVPADRFFGCVDEMMERINAGKSGSPLDLFATTERELELFKVVWSRKVGVAEIFLMGQKIFS